MRRIPMRFRSGLSVAGPKGHPRLSPCDPEKILMPKPTHPWHQVYRDEREANSRHNSPSSGTKTTDMSKRTISG